MISSSFSGVWGRLASGVADHLWQSTLCALLVALLVLALKKNHARIRYWLWFAASTKFLVPLSLLVILGSPLTWLHPGSPKQAVGGNADTYLVVDEVSRPFEFATAPLMAATPIPSVLERIRTSLGGSFLPAALTAIWLAGALFVAGRWTRRWWRISAVVRKEPALTCGREIEALQRMERLSGVRRSVGLKVLPIPVEPGIFGLFRPVLLWPEGISQRLSDAQLEGIIAHEICHVRRRDNITAALHMAAEAIFWFHPVVWWLEARLTEERETACDEDVLKLCGQARAYAESILKVCEFCVESSLPCVSGVTGADLRRRVSAILTRPARLRMTLQKKLLLGIASLCVLAVPIVMAQANELRQVMFSAIKVVQQPAQVAAPAMNRRDQPLSSGMIAEVQSPAAQRTASEPQTPGDISGIWQSTLDLSSRGQQPGRKLRFVLKVAKQADGSWGGVFYNIDQIPTPLTLSNVTISGGIFKYSIPGIGTTYEGNLSAEGKSIEGTTSLAGQAFPLTYVRATKETAWDLPQVPKPMAANVDPNFEVATIKPNNSGGPSMQGLGINGRNFTVRNGSLEDLIVFAYGVQKKQIVNVSAWQDEDRYDIAATVEQEGLPDLDQLKTMIRKLVADRFKLVVHLDKREMSAFVLSVDKVGSKFSPSQSKASAPRFMLHPEKNGVGLSIGNATMAELCGFLQSPILDRPVVNQTGIDGRYDVSIIFTPDDSQFNGHAPPVHLEDGVEPAPDLFTALKQQVGLKLRSEKTDVDMIAIDHAEKPSSN